MAAMKFQIIKHHGTRVFSFSTCTLAARFCPFPHPRIMRETTDAALTRDVPRLVQSPRGSRRLHTSP